MRGQIRSFKTNKVLQTVSCRETNDRVKWPFVFTRMWLKAEEKRGYTGLGNWGTMLSYGSYIAE